MPDRWRLKYYKNEANKLNDIPADSRTFNYRYQLDEHLRKYAVGNNRYMREDPYDANTYVVKPEPLDRASPIPKRIRYPLIDLHP